MREISRGVKEEVASCRERTAVKKDFKKYGGISETWEKETQRY